MATLREILRGGTSSRNTPKIFSGGFFSDVLDTLSIPQYAVTGALSGKKTIREAVRDRYTPSQALGVKSAVGKFATDVLLDPLNVVGAFGATAKGIGALKAGEAAATLGGAAQKGERVLLGLTKPFSNEVVLPLIKGEKALAGLTKAGEYLKAIPGIDKGLQALGAVPGVGTGKSVAEIEKSAQNFKNLKNTSTVGKAVMRAGDAKAGQIATDLEGIYKKALASGRVTAQELGDVIQEIARPTGKKFTGVADEVFQSMKPKIDELQNIRAKLDPNAAKLEGKVLKNVLTPELRDLKASKKPFVGAAREVGGNVGSEQFAKNVGLKSVNGTTSFAEFTGKTQAKLANGTRVRKLASDLYGTNEAWRAIDTAKQKAFVQNLDKTALVRSQAIRDAEVAVIENLKKTKPESIFTRVAVTPREANAALADLKQATRFSEDPAQILFAQAKDINRMVARQKFVDELTKIPDLAVPVKGKLPAGYARSKIKGLENYAFPEALVPHLDKTFKSFSSIESVNDFVKLYDKVQNTWKGFATYFNPSFHTRNAVSNHWQLFLSDVTDPIAHVRGYRAELAIRKALKNGEEIDKYVLPQYKQFVKEFVDDAGLRSTGAFSLDVDKSAASKLLDNPLGDLMGSAGETLENGAKLSLYIDKRLKGFKSKGAAMEVRKYLFDYADLTDFEKNVFKRIMPFYTWTRKNIPLQVAMLIQKPTKISAIAKAKAAIDSTRNGEPLEEKYMPEWLKEAYPIYFGTSPDGLQRYLKLEGFLPTVDLNKLGRPLETPFENLSPIIKTPVELISNYDFYFERQISEYSGQKTFMPLVPFTDLGLNVDNRLKKVIGNFRPLSEIQKFTINPNSTTNPTTTEALVNFLIGKTYQLDPQKQQSIFNYLQSKQESQIKSDIENLQSTGAGGDAELNRLLQLLQNTESGQGVKI